MFDLRNTSCKKNFYEFTSNEGRFTNIMKSNDMSVDVQFKRWKHMFEKSINACFRKIRVKEKVKLSVIDTLMEEKKVILKQKVVSNENQRKVEEIEQIITKEISEKEFERIKTVIGEFEIEPNTNMWREMRKAYPKINKSLPAGVKDFKGKVVTNPHEKKKVTLNTSNTE